tara:strand:- start:318 stop:881 length:564 start_codon:yes stop_codon:yes gene_type:complete
MAITLDDYIQEITQLAEGRDMSMRWYRDQVRAVVPKRLSESRTTSLIRAGNIQRRPAWGVLNLYGYDPKHEKILEYYDVFPLTIPIEKLKNGFIGINLHYLSVPMRMKLLTKLMPLTAENRIIGWRRVARFREVKPCVKRYLGSYVKTAFLPIIEHQEMELAAMMPIQRFRKARETKVWSDSRRMVM